MRQFHYVPYGASAPARALAIDAAVAGAAATYSHWRGAAPTPDELRADTSTGILLRAARDPGRWLDPYPVVVNNHADVDGLLAAWAAVHPRRALDQGDLLVAAAEAGDFQEWTGVPAATCWVALLRRLVAWRAGRPDGAWEEEAYRALLAMDALPAVDPDDAAIVRILQVAERLAAGRQIAAQTVAVPALGGSLLAIAWDAVAGHPAHPFAPDDPDAADDLPLWAISAGLPGSAAQHQLLSWRRGAAWWHRLEAPRHAWALTVSRPPWRLTDLSGAVAGLPGIWRTGASALAAGMTCLLEAGPVTVSPEALLRRLDAG
jgi:hypothetical protein